MRYAHRETFEPIGEVKHILQLLPEDHPKAGLWKILYLETLHPIDYDFGVIAAGEASGDKEVEDLYMPDNEGAHYRYVLLDDFTMLIKQPKSATRHVTDSKMTEATFLGQQSGVRKLGDQEFFVIEDEKIFFDATEPTKKYKLKHRVRFYGYRLVLEKVAAAEVVTPINVGGR